MKRIIFQVDSPTLARIETFQRNTTERAEGVDVTISAVIRRLVNLGLDAAKVPK